MREKIIGDIKCCLLGIKEEDSIDGRMYIASQIHHSLLLLEIDDIDMISSDIEANIIYRANWEMYERRLQEEIKYDMGEKELKMSREFFDLLKELLDAINKCDRLETCGLYVQLEFALSDTYYGAREFLSESDYLYVKYCMSLYPSFKKTLVTAGIISDEELQEQNI